MTPEVVRADPAKRRALVIVLLVTGFLLALLYGLVGDPFEWLVERMLAYVDAVAETDPERAQAVAGRYIIGALGVAWLLCAAVVGFFVVTGFRMWGAEQWPLPGARPIVDQKVRRGTSLTVRAALLIVVPLLALAAQTYFTLHFALWALAEIAGG